MITIANWISNLMIVSTAIFLLAVGIFILYVIISTLFNK